MQCLYYCARHSINYLCKQFQAVWSNFYSYSLQTQGTRSPFKFFFHCNLTKRKALILLDFSMKLVIYNLNQGAFEIPHFLQWHTTWRQRVSGRSQQTQASVHAWVIQRAIGSGHTCELGEWENLVTGQYPFPRRLLFLFELSYLGKTESDFFIWLHKYFQVTPSGQGRQPHLEMRRKLGRYRVSIFKRQVIAWERLWPHPLALRSKSFRSLTPSHLQDFRSLSDSRENDDRRNKKTKSTNKQKHNCENQQYFN